MITEAATWITVIAFGVASFALGGCVTFVALLKQGRIKD